MNAPPVFYNIEKLLPWLHHRVPLLTPNQRLAGHIRSAWGRHLAAGGKQGWESAAVYSLSQWWQHCERQTDPWCEAERHLLNETEDLELWLHCIRRSTVDGSLLRPRATARQARTAYHQLLLWQIDWNSAPAAHHFQHSEDAGLLLQWIRSFERYCREHQLSLPEWEFDRWARDFPQDTLVLVEFDQLPPLAEAALRQQAQHLLQHSNAGAEGKCVLQACASPNQELASAADWARRRLQQDPAAPIAILLGDVAAQRPRLERLLREGLQPEAEVTAALPVNFSAGTPLNRLPMISTALGFLSLLEGEMEVDRLVPLLHSRYRRFDDPARETRLLQALYQRGQSRIGLDELAGLVAGRGLGSRLLALGQRRELRRKLPPSRWAGLLPQYLENWGWPGPQTLDSTEYQVYRHWQDCLQLLAGLDRVRAPCRLASALELLGGICADTLFQAQTADSPLQVLGLLEAAGMEFEHIWLCGAGANHWPAPARPNPFIPLALQREVGLPHADSGQEYDFSRRLLQRFSRSCRTLIASYAQWEDETEQRPSALLAQFGRAPAAGGEPGQAELGKAQLSRRWRAAAALPMLELEDIRAPAVMPGELPVGGSDLLEDQSLCGFRAFVRQRLRVRALPELAVGLTAAQRGTLLHLALYYLWGRLHDSATMAATSALHPQWIEAAIDSAIAEFNRNLRYRRRPVELLQLERQRLSRLLRQWLEIEAGRDEFEVVAREEQREFTIGKLQLNLRTDRLDRLKGGELLVVDYKSGDSEVRYWMGERPQQPQLPLYACALGEQCAGASFALVATDKPGYKGLSAAAAGAGIRQDIGKASGGKATEWPVLQRHWQSVLEELAEAFVRGDAAVDPPDTRVSCRWCGLQPLCRIHEQDVNEDA